MFSFSPSYGISKGKRRSLEDATAVGSSRRCSVGPADTLSSWLMSADAHKPPQLEAAGEASAGSCSLLPARRHSEAHHLPRQPLEDAAPAVETSGVREKVERASPASVIVTEPEVQVTSMSGHYYQAQMFMTCTKMTGCFSHVATATPATLWVCFRLGGSNN